MEPSPVDNLRKYMSYFYMTNINNIITNTVNKMYVSESSMIINAWNLLPAWISYHNVNKRRSVTRKATVLDNRLRNFVQTRN